MAIIYSYTQETNPQPSDLLFGTDVGSPNKATKSFSIQNIVNLVQDLVPGGGTVTSISTNATNYITMSGGPITTTGTLTASLSATGTASTATFLRGDNVWATPDAGLNTTYALTGAQSGINSNIRLTGSDGSQTILSLLAGPNIVLTNNGSSNITIGVTGLPEGTVTSVTAAGGLYIVSGSATVNPVLAVDLTGLNNYIKIGQSQTTVISDDFIAFNQSSSTNVKTTTLGAITPAALTLVKDYIDAGDVGDIRNDTDTYTDVANVDQVVSLSSTEYTALANKNANTLYVVVAPAIEYTTTLAFTNNISGTLGTEYIITGDQAGLPKTGIAGASYSYNSGVQALSGFYFSTPASISNAVGIFTADQTVNTTLSGTISAVAQPTITATLAIDTSGVTGGNFTLGGEGNGATRTIAANSLTVPDPGNGIAAFNTTISADAGYVFTTPAVVDNWTGTINGNQVVTTTITGVVEQASQNTVTVTANVAENFTGAYASQASVQVGPPTSFSGNNSVVYDFTVTPTVATGYYFVNPPVITGDLTGSSSTTRTADIFVSAQVEQIQNEAIVNLVVQNSIDGPTAGYNITGNQTGDQKIGSVQPSGFSYAFSTDVILTEGYEWVSGQVPTIYNASDVTSQIGEQTATTTIFGAQVVESVGPTIATLRLTYNITQDGVLNPPNPVWSPSGNIDGDQQSAVGTLVYDFTNISPGAPTITIPANYQFDVPASTTPSVISDSISVSQDVNATVQATISEIPVSYYTLQKCSTGGFGFTTNLNTTQLTFTLGDIVLDTANSEYYTVVGETSTQGSTFVSLTALTSCPAQLYYWNAIQCSGTGTVKISTTNAGISAGDSYTYNSVCYRIVDSDPTENPAYNIDTFSGCCTANVNVNFTNNVSGKANTTTTIADGTTVSATGIVGQQYTITNSISANPGFEFTVPASWSSGGTGTVTGTFVSGTTEINQNVTGTVVESPTCKTYEITNDAGPGQGAFVYADCRTGNAVTGQVPFGDSIEVCSREGEISGGDVTIIETGSC